MIESDEIMPFEKHNKFLVVMCVKSHHECWENRCKLLCETEVQKISMINEIEAIWNESNRVNIRKSFRYVETPLINVETANVKELTLWVKSVQKF